jgi:endo-1,4-beta-xylanase
MKITRNALLRGCLLASVPIASMAQAPTIVEAESGSLGTSLTTGTDATAGVNYITVLPAANNGATPTPDRVATYQVTFPAAGNYALYVRILAGPIGGADDSFYVPSGFNNTTNWSGLYNTSTGGATAPGAGVSTTGSAGQNVWKWVRLTSIPGIGDTSIGPTAWVVPDGALTQSFSWGSREDGLLFDKLAFGPVNVCYSVGDLDAGRASTISCPPPQTPPAAYTRPAGSPLAAGQPKYLGSAHSAGQASLNFAAYWNQVTPENGGKWGTAQPTSPFGPADQGYPTLANPQFNWTQATGAYNQARTTGAAFKWHTLFWGNQQPAWIESLPVAKQQEAIRIWLAAIAAQFPDIEQIDVVNEPLHDPPRGATNGNYIDALGGSGDSGWDWIINAFTLAREYFPNAKLVLNDYSITNDGNATTNYLTIIGLLQSRGLIDQIGIQGHAFEFNYNNLPQSAATHRGNLARLAATGLPIYVTEFDIDGADATWGLPDDPAQLLRYQTLFPVFWESPAVKGVTLWGYMQNSHWRSGFGAWLMYTNGAERPALQWLVRYVENKPAVVAPGQVFSINEMPESAERKAARAFLEANGFPTDDTAITTAALMAANPGTFTDAFGTWTGGLANYSGTNAQAVAFYLQFGHVGGATVGQVVATDPDAGTLSKWELNSNCSQYAINPDTGVISVIPGADMDFEHYTSCAVRVSVWDGYVRSAVETVTININNLNDNKPSVTPGQRFPIDGGAHNVIDAIEVSDPDDINQIGFTTFSNFAITSGNTNSVFRLRATDGTLEVARPLFIDWRKTSYTLGTTVSDGANTSAVESVVVDIPKRVEFCLANTVRLEVPKATAPLAVLLGAELGGCRAP